MNLTAANVNQVFVDCLFTTEEMRQANGNPDPAIIVEGIGVKFGFHPGRLESHRADVASMLSELPPEFMKNGGGGWSFLNACVTKDGVQWGEHRNINELICLGIGLGIVKWSFPRDMWQDLPGGMPYFVVNTDGFPAQEKMCPNHPVHKLDKDGRCPQCLVDKIFASEYADTDEENDEDEDEDDDNEEDEELSEEEQLAKAVDLYEGLLCAADGRKNEKLDTFDAQTILLMLEDEDYLNKVMKAHEKAYG